MKRLIIVIALLLAGCNGWDMDLASWSAAETLCLPFGGAVAADSHWTGGNDRTIKSLCATGQTVARTFTKDELNQLASTKLKQERP